MTPVRGAGPWLVAAAVLLWLGAWFWAGRHALLDDALIHLRFAHHLRDSGVFSFDGVTPSYGASSPLYVGLLSLLARLSSSPLVAKGASLLAYLALLGTVASAARRPGGARASWVAAALCLLSPMALLWLTDGMETAWSALLAILVVSSAAPEAPAAQLTRSAWGSAAGDFLLGAAAVLTRVELALAIGFAVAASLSESGWRDWRRRLPLAAGGLVGLGILQLVFGHLLPDTAVAKTAPAAALWDAAWQVARSTGAALSLGIGLAGLWLATLALAWRRAAPRERAGLLVANLLFPAVVALIALRGHTVHGIRHLLWVYCFLVAWNSRTLAVAAGARSSSGRRRWLIPLAAALLALAWIGEGRLVGRLLGQRNELLRSMRGAGLERLRDSTGGACDVGFIAFFSGARMLDFNGLVNGRELAALPWHQRLALLAAERPDFLFLTAEQARQLGRHLDLDTYRVCGRYSMQFLTTRKDYFLALAPGAPRAGFDCPAPLDAALAAAGPS